jgi:hypothetical protein
MHFKMQHALALCAAVILLTGCGGGTVKPKDGKSEELVVPDIKPGRGAESSGMPAKK